MAALAALPLPTHGRLAGLVRLYFAQVDAVNALPTGTSDEALNAAIDSGPDATMARIADEPVRTRADAIAALDWIEGVECPVRPFEDAIGLDEETAARLVEHLREFLSAGTMGVSA